MSDTTLPIALSDPPVGECGRCHRKTWDTSTVGTDDTMPQPSGLPCGGRFVAIQTKDHGPLAAILSDRTLAKVLSRPAYVPAGTEPEPFSVEGMHIVSGWLVEPVGEHTCGTGPNGHYGAHEPGCGYEPVARLDDLPGWPGEHASSDIPSIVELDQQQALDSLIANAIAWANGPSDHKGLDGALRLAVADYERAVQS